MTEAALIAELGREPTVSLMTRRRASAPPAQPPPQPTDAVSASSTSAEISASQPKRRSQSSGSAANSENISGGSNTAKSASRDSEGKAGGSTPAIHQNHPENLCRYPNKRCYNKRAVKNNGELHKFCDKHRDSANRYQRKLEQRLKEKRIQSRMRALQAQQAQAHAQMVHAQAHGHTPFSVVDPVLMGSSSAAIGSPYPGIEVYGGAIPHVPSGTMAPARSTMVPQAPFPGAVAPASSGNTSTGLWAQGEDEYEPYQHPVQLQDEDLDCLDLLFEQ